MASLWCPKPKHQSIAIKTKQYTTKTALWLANLQSHQKYFPFNTFLWRTKLLTTIWSVSWDHPKKNFLSPNKIAIFSYPGSIVIIKQINCLLSLENSNFYWQNAVQPNHEKPGGPNPPTNKTILFNIFEYNLSNKHVMHFD